MELFRAVDIRPLPAFGEFRMAELKNRVALVTGASEAVAASIRKKGGSAVAFGADVSLRGAVQSMVRDIEQRLGPIVMSIVLGVPAVLLVFAGVVDSETLGWNRRAVADGHRGRGSARRTRRPCIDTDALARRFSLPEGVGYQEWYSRDRSGQDPPHALLYCPACQSRLWVLHAGEATPGTPIFPSDTE